jgi:hypothetical protein
MILGRRKFFRRRTRQGSASPGFVGGRCRGSLDTEKFLPVQQMYGDRHWCSVGLRVLRASVVKLLFRYKRSRNYSAGSAGSVLVSASPVK